jgi:hypothetical protein
MFTAELLRPADIVFSDTAMNREFHHIFETQSVPVDFSKDIYGIQKSKPWYPLIAYFISLSNETDMHKIRFTVDRISRDVAWRVIRLHPMEYARLVVDNLFFYLVPTDIGRWYFWPGNPPQAYNRAVYAPHPPIQYLLPLFYGERGYPNTDRMNLSMKTALDLPMRVKRLPTYTDIWMNTIFVLLFVFASAVGVILFLQKRKDARLLGAVILLCLANTFLHALAQALITRIHEVRFRLPGMFSFELAIILSIVSLFPLRHLLPTKHAPELTNAE